MRLDTLLRHPKSGTLVCSAVRTNATSVASGGGERKLQRTCSSKAREGACLQRLLLHLPDGPHHVPVRERACVRVRAGAAPTYLPLSSQVLVLQLTNPGLAPVRASHADRQRSRALGRRPARSLARSPLTVNQYVRRRRRDFYSRRLSPLLTYMVARRCAGCVPLPPASQLLAAIVVRS